MREAIKRLIWEPDARLGAIFTVVAWLLALVAYVIQRVSPVNPTILIFLGMSVFFIISAASHIGIFKNGKVK